MERNEIIKITTRNYSSRVQFNTKSVGNKMDITLYFHIQMKYM